MNNPFEYRRAAWAFDRRAQAEHTPPAIIATLQQYGLTGYHTEVYYGMRPQGDIDGYSPTTIEAMTQEFQQFANAGIAWVPVVVPRALIGEAELHAEAAKVAGAIVVDIETGDDYWPWASASLVRVYARALREACGPDVMIAWQPDARLADNGTYNRADRTAEWNQYVAACAPYIDVYMPQVYAGWSGALGYGVGAGTIALDVERYRRFAELGATYPTLYTSDSLPEPVGLWAACKGLGATGFCGFRLGAMNKQALITMREMELPARPVPIPDPPPIPIPDPPSPDPVIDLRSYFDEIARWGDDDIAEITRRRDMRLERLAQIEEEVGLGT